MYPTTAQLHSRFLNNSVSHAVLRCPGALHVAKASLEVSCLCLPSAGIIDVCHYRLALAKNDFVAICLFILDNRKSELA